jgi:uncharacterized protein with PQ loop repeat
MKFDIIDPNVGLTMNVFLIIGNIICIGYNIPQMIHTYKSRSTGDINEWFIILRIIGNSPFVAYSIYTGEVNLFISYAFSIFSSLFIGYFKYMEIRYSKREEDEELKELAEYP